MNSKKILIAAVLLIGLVLVVIFFIGQPTGPEAEDFQPTQPEMFEINGTVKEVKTNSLVIETEQFHSFEQLPTEREILVTEDTTIVIRAERGFEDYEEELEPPDFSFTEMMTTLNQIEIGNQVRVEADQDISSAESFTATRITVIFQLKLQYNFFKSIIVKA